MKAAQNVFSKLGSFYANIATMETIINISHDNFHLELEIEDSQFWNTLSKGEKDHIKLLKSFVFAAHDYISSELSDKPSEVILNIHYCRTEQVQSLNSQYRNNDKDTDVLSFPLFESLGELPIDTPAVLGDIYISLDQALKQSLEHSIDLSSELVHLIIHGFFHLLGLDHERSEAEAKQMDDLEQKMLTRVQNTYSRI